MNDGIVKVLLVLAAALMLTVGCEKDEPKPPAGGGEAGEEIGGPTPTPTPIPTPTPTVDVKDPNAVAKAFVEAVAAKDIDKLISYVHPDQKAELRGEFARGFPDVPDDWNVSVKVNGDEGTFEGNVTALKNLKMVKDEGRWWVAD